MQQPKGTAAMLAGLGRAVLAFISTGKFYCCNYTLNCTKSSSEEAEQRRAQEGTFTPALPGASPSCPARAGSEPGAQQVPEQGHIPGISKALEVTPGGFPPLPCAWGPEPSCEGHPDLPLAASPALNPPHPALPPPRSGFPVIW